MLIPPSATAWVDLPRPKRLFTQSTDSDGSFVRAPQVDRAIALTVRHVGRLREMSPLWEMVQEGIDITRIKWAQH